MNDLSDKSRSLIQQVEDVGEPNAADRERVRSALIARLGPGAFGGSTTPGAPETGAPPALPHGQSFAIKILLGIGVIGLVAGGVLFTRRAPSPMHVESAPLQLATTSVATAPPAAVSVAEPEATPVEQLPIEAPSAALRSARAPRAAASAPSVADEVAILSGAYSALKHGDADKALTELDRHAGRFPDGALAEERAAQRVLALCQLGRVDEARADAARFLERYPNSPQAARVRGSCGGSSPTP